MHVTLASVSLQAGVHTVSDVVTNVEEGKRSQATN